MNHREHATHVIAIHAERRKPVRTALIVLATLTLVAGSALGGARQAQAATGFEVESLDGSGNNVANPNWGQAGHAVRPGRRRPSTPTASAQPVAGPNAALRQQPHLQRHQPERVLRAPGHPVGLDLGPVPRPHLRPARTSRRPSTAPTSRSTRADPLEDFTQQPRRDPVQPVAPAAPGHRRRRNPRQQINTDRLATSTRQPVYGAHRHPAGLAARRPGRRQPDQQQRHADAARRLPAPPRPPAATRPPRRRWTSTAGCWPTRTTPSSPATCGPTRTSR